MKNEAMKINIYLEEGKFVSNQDEIRSPQIEYIRDQMVNYVTDNEVNLNIPSNSQYTNGKIISFNIVRKKMVVD